MEHELVHREYVLVLIIKQSRWRGELPGCLFRKSAINVPLIFTLMRVRGVAFITRINV